MKKLYLAFSLICIQNFQLCSMESNNTSLEMQLRNLSLTSRDEDYLERFLEQIPFHLDQLNFIRKKCLTILCLPEEKIDKKLYFDLIECLLRCINIPHTTSEEALKLVIKPLNKRFYNLLENHFYKEVKINELIEIIESKDSDINCMENPLIKKLCRQYIIDPTLCKSLIQKALKRRLQNLKKQLHQLDPRQLLSYINAHVAHSDDYICQICNICEHYKINLDLFQKTAKEVIKEKIIKENLGYMIPG